MNQNRVIRIGGASGFWGDSGVGAPQLVASGQIDYLVFDYLAELTMSVMASARLKKPELGYATDFVTVAMKAVLRDVTDKRIRIVSNAGGVNPQGCADALRALAAEQNVSLKIALVTGDDVMPLVEELRVGKPPVTELQSGAPLPDKLLTANAYLGAGSIKAALDAGADVVITGRCVDSAVTLGVLMHEFGWSESDWDKLASGSLAGHILECGCQATGGLHTDWESVPDWAHIGYPIVECKSDGSFVVTKPEGTGGLVAPQAVAEQMLYEIGDPATYLLPDVVCDFTQVKIIGDGPQRVRVQGARGRAPTNSYKVCATYTDGFKTSAQMTVIGFDAAAKAHRTGEAILERVGEMLAAQGFAPFSRTHVEILGAESCFGPHAKALGTREVVLRLSACHTDKAALELLSREIAPAGTSWAPGTTGFSGRASVSPMIRQYAFLLDKDSVEPRVHLDGVQVQVTPAPRTASGTPPAPEGLNIGPESEKLALPSITVPLILLAWARSGDKGNTSNIGVIARQPKWLPLLRAQLTAESVGHYLGHLVEGPVTRYEVPGIDAFNFVCERALGGGGMSSLRNDALGKGMAQILLNMSVQVPEAWVPEETLQRRKIAD